MANILICDDEKDIVAALKIYLGTEGYQIYEAYNGKEALHIMDEYEIHLVLLDIMMPEMDGIQTLSEIRKTSNVPVIFLTAKSEDTDMILGLNVGADDYITKPFNPVEVQARVRSHLRRYLKLGSHTLHDEMLAVGGIELNPKSKEVTLDGEPVSLTRTEYRILEFLLAHPGEIFTPAEIYRKVWNGPADGTDNIVAVHIRHLREKIEYDPSHPRYLKVIWGQGYKLQSNVDSSL